jgi:hypothetical protein
MLTKRYHNLLFVVLLAFCGCRKYTSYDKVPAPPLPPEIPKVLLKDIQVSHLPSPYYHFEYDASGKISGASFAADFFKYNVSYAGNRISEVRNNILVNKDRLTYTYDNMGRAILVTYADSLEKVYARVTLEYSGYNLISLKRERKLAGEFVTEKELTMTYYPDDNLKDLTYHYLPVNGHPEGTYTDHFSNYDDKVNVDGFDLLHNEFFDHVVLLPGVRLQKNNPRMESRSGGGENFTVTYSYTYNNNNYPLTKNGELDITTGPLAGQHFQTSSFFSYY